MPEPRLSVLIVARNEAANLAGCLAAAGSPTSGSSWSTRPAGTRRSRSPGGTPRSCQRPRLRQFREPAERGAGPGLGRLGAVDRRRRAGHARAGRRDPRAGWPIPRARYVGFRVPIRSEILGRPFRYSGTQQDNPAAALPPRSRAMDRPGPRDRRDRRADRPDASRARAPDAARCPGLSGQDRPVHDARGPRPPRGRARGSDRATWRSGRSGRSSSSTSTSRGSATASRA